MSTQVPDMMPPMTHDVREMMEDALAFARRRRGGSQILVLPVRDMVDMATQQLTDLLDRGGYAYRIVRHPGQRVRFELPGDGTVDLCQADFAARSLRGYYCDRLATYGVSESVLLEIAPRTLRGRSGILVRYGVDS